jgi:hypothetical protein
MTAILDATVKLTEDLRAAGIRATMDVRNLNLPTLLVVPPVWVADLMCGGTASFVIYALTRGPANLDAWKSLDTLLAEVSKVVDEVREVRPTSYDPEGNGGLPALEITFDHSLTWAT